MPGVHRTPCVSSTGQLHQNRLINSRGIMSKNVEKYYYIFEIEELNNIYNITVYLIDHHVLKNCKRHNSHYFLEMFIECFYFVYKTFIITHSFIICPSFIHHLSILVSPIIKDTYQNKQNESRCITNVLFLNNYMSINDHILVNELGYFLTPY